MITLEDTEKKSDNTQSDKPVCTCNKEFNDVDISTSRRNYAEEVTAVLGIILGLILMYLLTSLLFSVFRILDALQI